MRSRLVAGLLLTVLLGGCGAPAEEVTSGSTTTTGPGAGWEQLPPSPLSPRGRAVLVDLGDDGLLVLGGDMVADCRDMRAGSGANETTAGSSAASGGAALVSASTLSCAPLEQDPRLSDGAILESPTGEWKLIADAPAPISDLSRGVVIGDTVYLVAWRSFATNGPTTETWMAYDASEDAWRKLADAPAGAHLVRAGDRIIAYRISEEQGPAPDFVYDPEIDSWSELPTDPLSPSFDRSMVWTGDEVVLLANELVPNPGAERPSLVRAAALDPETEQWRRLPDSEIIGGHETWWWSGDRVVNAVPRRSDGGETGNYGRHYPHGGMLDPRTGEWSALPDAPTGGSCSGDDQFAGPDFGYHAAGPDAVVNDRLAFHVRARTWEPVPCNKGRANFSYSSTWAFGGLVVFGGYDAGREPGEALNDYQFTNAAWIWRPSE